MATELLFIDFGAASNLAATLDSVVEIDNEWGHPTIGVRVTPPTNGAVSFQATFDGIYWNDVSLRSISSDSFVQSTNVVDSFIGSIIGARKFRFRTSVLGSAAGTIMGRIQSTVGIAEGVEAIVTTSNTESDASIASIEKDTGTSRDILKMMYLEMKAMRLAIVAMVCEGGKNSDSDFEPDSLQVNNGDL